MMRILKMIAAIVATVILAAVAGGAPALAAGPEDSVNSFHETLLGLMKQGRMLGESGRYARIEPVIRRLFDIPSMARLAVGATWASLSQAQQEATAAAFGGYISATYADRFDSYSGQQMEVVGQQPSGSGVIVRARLI